MLYETITVEDKTELQEMIENAIFDQKEKDLANDLSLYNLSFQDKPFQVAVTDSELKDVVMIAIEIVEELKSINNAGMNRTAFEQLDKEVEAETSAIKRVTKQQSFFTDRMNELLAEAAKTVRVGGAYFMLFAMPLIVDAIFAAMRVIIDKFDDEQLYQSCAYMLTRMILKMHEEHPKFE